MLTDEDIARIKGIAIDDKTAMRLAYNKGFTDALLAQATEASDAQTLPSATWMPNLRDKVRFKQGRAGEPRRVFTVRGTDSNGMTVLIESAELAMCRWHHVSELEPATPENDSLRLPNEAWLREKIAADPDVDTEAGTPPTSERLATLTRGPSPPKGTAAPIPPIPPRHRTDPMCPHCRGRGRNAVGYCVCVIAG